jgi:pre-mRNA-processing factor 40
LLKGLVESGKIKARTKWKEVYPVFSTDERYLSMLGNPGSNPLELFWDVVDHLDQELDAKIAVVDGAIFRYNAQRITSDNVDTTGQAFSIGPDTSEEEYMKIITEDNHDSVKALSQADFRSVFITARDICHRRLFRILTIVILAT